MDLESLSQRVFDLQEKVAAVIAINNKVDGMLDRLTLVSQDISKILAAQTERLENQEKVGATLSSMMEKRKDEVDKDLDHIHAKMDRNEKEIEIRFEKIYDKMDKQHDFLKSRFSKIEKWIWVVTGGGMVVGFLVSQVLPKLL